MDSEILGTFFKMSLFEFHKREKVIQGWNYMKVNNCWQNLHKKKKTLSTALRNLTICNE